MTIENKVDKDSIKNDLPCDPYSGRGFIEQRCPCSRQSYSEIFADAYLTLRAITNGIYQSAKDFLKEKFSKKN